MKRSPSVSLSQVRLPLGHEVQIDYRSAEYLREPVIDEIRTVLGNNGRITKEQLTSQARDAISSLLERRNLEAEFKEDVIIIRTGDDKDDPGEQWNGNN